MITAAPRSAKALAVASPIPALAPMMTTRCPSKDMLSGFPSLSRLIVLTTLYRYCQFRQMGRLPGMDETPPRRPHTGRRRNDAAKDAILDATFRLLGRLGRPGAESVTIEAIAAEAGVGRQTIYRWWPT